MESPIRPHYEVGQTCLYCEGKVVAKALCQKHYERWQNKWSMEQEPQGWTERGYRWRSINGEEVREHRHVMEQHLGRKLRKDELVHHINEDRADNRLENLQVVSRSEHTKIHRLWEDSIAAKT